MSPIGRWFLECADFTADGRFMNPANLFCTILLSETAYLLRLVEMSR